MSRVKMENFLVKDLDQETKARIEILGNVVVPAQAGLAMTILSGVSNLQPETE